MKKEGKTSIIRMIFHSKIFKIINKLTDLVYKTIRNNLIYQNNKNRTKTDTKTLNMTHQAKY